MASSVTGRSISGSFDAAMGAGGVLLVTKGRGCDEGREPPAASAPRETKEDDDDDRLGGRSASGAAFGTIRGGLFANGFTTALLFALPAALAVLRRFPQAIAGERKGRSFIRQPSFRVCCPVHESPFDR